MRITANAVCKTSLAHCSHHLTHSLDDHLRHKNDCDGEVGVVDGILPAFVHAMVRLCRYKRVREREREQGSDSRPQWQTSLLSN